MGWRAKQIWNLIEGRTHDVLCDLLEGHAAPPNAAGHIEDQLRRLSEAEGAL
jgi:hypothetical protein